MTFRRALSIVAIAVGLGACPVTMALAQDTPVPKDDALDSLLKELSNPSDRADKGPAKSAATKKETQAKKKPDGAATPKAGAGEEPGTKQTGPAGGKASEKAASKPGGSTSLTGKDQEVDELLEKLGETRETPSPDERPRGGAGGGEKTDGRRPAGQPDQTDRSRLSGKDKETDEHLEELTGRRRRKKQDDGQRSGPAGQIIKEMRDIEQKLEKPDTGESTREEQKKVVKRIETLIEEMKRSGQSSMGRIRIRRVRQPGTQPGRQRGSTDGAMAQGAPLTKPKRPTTKHSTAGGKDIWGHLPDQLKEEMQNMWNELPLSTKEALIDRYYLSIGKGKLVREETP